MNRIAFTLEDLQLEIAKTCAKGKIFQENVRLIAVSKRQSAAKIRQLAAQGQSEFAENQLQEALDKMSQLTDLSVKWHFIGAIQSRKCKAIAEHFDWVQSVDREKLISKLNDARPTELSPLNVCIQLNYFDEPQKSGAKPNEVETLAKMITEMPNLKLRGLMVLPPKQTTFSNQKQQFDEINDFYQHLKQQYPKMDTLSMGMSNDFQAAILAGSTMIRVGTALFGARQDTELN
ncbi:MAG: YggS family pyridoxal phosphate-dependent enzyme [Kangiellaceae bacterium]|nr:YggS family pyridoxal phosphate-dependent enzyme [Kangiellaceae bacterium]